MAVTPKKISEFEKAGALGAGVLLASSGGAIPAAKVMPSKPIVQLWADGDSKAHEGAEAAQWAIAKDPREVWITRNFGEGGSNTGTGSSPPSLTNPGRMAIIGDALLTATAAGSIVDVIITIGTNDVMLAGYKSETIVANIRKYHDHIRSRGARYLILMAIDPRVGLSASSAAKVIATNRAYADYCESVSDAFFVDPSGWWIDPASALYAPRGGATGAAGSMAADGLHANANGIYAKQFAIAPILQMLYRPRALEVLSAGDSYDPVDSIRGNILGAGGRFVAMGGTNNITGGGGVTGTPPFDCRNAGELSGSAALAYSTANCGALATKFGATWPVVRATLSGTPSTSGGINLVGRNAWFEEGGTRPMIGRALLSCNGLTGIAGFSLLSQNISPPMAINLGRGDGIVLADQLPQLDGLISIDLFVVPATNIHSGLNLYANFIGGVPLGGSVDLIGIDWRRWDAIPAAAA